MRRINSHFVLALIFACLAITACTSAQTSQAHNFDRQAFNTLMTAQGAIEAAKVEAKGQPANVIHQLNQVIKKYNDAYDVYMTYHNAVAITANASDGNLKESLIALLDEVATLRQMMGHKGGAQ